MNDFTPACWPLFSGTIQNCYDSHVHWRATGQFARKLDLKNLRSPQDVMSLLPRPENYYGEWLQGYGWDHNKFESGVFPTRAVLDEKFGETPVYFVRVDGHAAWANTAAMKLVGLWQKNLLASDGGRILLGNDGYPTGIFIDLAMVPFMRHFSQATIHDIKSDLLAGQKAFHRAGFTHIRDLTCDNLQWQAECELADRGELRMAVEQFFSADNPLDFSQRLQLALHARREKRELLHVCGVKAYFDGALGSEGAWLSQPYQSGSGVGLKLLEDKQLQTMMAECFAHELDFALHVIGDEAAHRAAVLAYELKEKGHSGVLHLEHAELLRPETIEILRHLNVRCHFQPCHWLSDKVWLKNKIGDLTSHAFRWQMLEAAGIPFYFGSDSPIEKTSVQRNFLAIHDAAMNGIEKPLGDFSMGHAHPDTTWCPQTYTQFHDGEPTAVIFRSSRVK